MEVVVPLVVGGLAGLSVVTACGAEPRVPQVPPKEMAHQTLELVAERLPRELVENDTLARLVSMPNVLITSHQAFLTREALDGIAGTTMENLRAFFAGEELKNEVG